MAMKIPSFEVTLIPLVPNVKLPGMASARTRVQIPSGRGVQEECLPFTAASALGLLIPSPIEFGLCAPGDVPAGCRAFRSPLNRAGTDGQFAEPRVFFVLDSPDCRFFGNAYEFEDIPGRGSQAATVREPGISFFDREDQQDLFKLHLPYIWRTPESIDTLFLPLLNRPGLRPEALSGLVETDWYASPVNLVLRKTAGACHVRAGDPVAQAAFIPRDLRRPSVEVAASHSRIAREARKGLAEWDRQHAASDNAYKILARSRHGRIENESGE
jgi:hypothetical protein